MRETNDQTGRPRSALADLFHKFSNRTSATTGSPLAFIVALLTIVIWAVTGPIFGFSDTWQLVINTSTTIVTFLMVFLIQNTQNRDAKAVHLKLDELIRAITSARNSLIDLEEMSEDELQKLEGEFRKLSSRPCSPQKPPAGTAAPALDAGPEAV